MRRSVPPFLHSLDRRHRQVLVEPAEGALDEVELVGEADVDGVAAYHLKLTLKSGSVQQWYLSRDDYQAVRKVAVGVHRRAGPYDRIWYLMEHQSTGGITLPFYVEREDRQHVRAYTVDKVEVGVEIDPALFEMPEASPDGS